MKQPHNNDYETFVSLTLLSEAGFHPSPLCPDPACTHLGHVLISQRASR